VTSSRRRLNLIFGALVSVVACSATRSSYFGAQSDVRISGPASVGNQALIGAANVVVHSGDTITLEQVTLDGASVGTYTPYLIRLKETGGGIGGLEGDVLSSGRSFSRLAIPLAGYRLSASDGETQIVLSFSSDHPRRIEFNGLALTFRVNDGDEQAQDFPVAGAVCFGSPRPDRCDGPGGPSE
jgi:hypothetical protein